MLGSHLVGKGRLELPRLSAHDPKSCSSTNSDTSPTQRDSKPALSAEHAGPMGLEPGVNRPFWISSNNSVQW